MRTSFGKVEWHSETIQTFQCLDDSHLACRLDEEHDEAASTCTRYLAAQCTCFLGHTEGFLNDGVGDGIGHLLLVFPCLSKNAGKLIHIALQDRQLHVDGTLFDAMHGLDAPLITRRGAFPLLVDDGS